MIGYDHLGLAHKLYPVKKVISLTPFGACIGVFDDPFGPVLKKLKQIVESGKFPAVRIHAHWSTTHRIVPLEKLKKKLPTYEKFAQAHPGIKVYVSHSCEYDESSKAEVQTRVDLIRKLAPSCIPVNSCYKGATIPGVLTERHGGLGLKGDIVSTDGINIYDIDAEKWVQENVDCELTFVWGSRNNLREIPDPGQPVPPPDQRTAAPDDKYLLSNIRITRPRGLPPTPTFSGNIVAINGKTVWKTHAEDDQEDDPFEADDPRENRPVFISPSKAKFLEIVTYQGVSIGKLPYYGTYQGGMHRHYSGSPGGIRLYGYEIANKAQKASGSEFVWLKDGRTFYGPLHPAFRTGYFR